MQCADGLPTRTASFDAVVPILERRSHRELWTKVSRVEDWENSSGTTPNIWSGRDSQIPNDLLMII